jgi:hypothetical protein
MTNFSGFWMRRTGFTAACSRSFFVGCAISVTRLRCPEPKADEVP